jgi:hypothetical protein
MKKLLLLPFLFCHLFLSAQYPKLIPYRNGNLWGYCDSAKKIIIPCKYDSVGMFQSKYFIPNNFSAQVVLNGERKTLYNNGNVITDSEIPSNLPPSFLTVTNSDYPPVLSISASFGWVDMAHNSLNFPPTVFYICKSTTRVLNVGDNGKYGYNDCKGNPVIHCRFIEAEEFSEGLAAVHLNDSISGYINIKGNFVVKYKNAVSLGNFSNGLAFVELEKGTAVINGLGTFIIPPKKSQEITEWENFYIVHDLADTTYMLFNKNGTLADKRKFDLIEECVDQLIKVIYDGKVNFLNKDGKEISKIWYAQTMPFSSSLYIPVANEEGKWGFIDQQGKVVLPLKYEQPEKHLFQENLCKMGNQGYIDISGKEYWEN